MYRLVERCAGEVASLAGRRVCRLLHADVDINTVRAWLGHARIDTTNVYAEIDVNTKARAIALCDLVAPPPTGRVSGGRDRGSGAARKAPWGGGFRRAAARYVMSSTSRPAGGRRGVGLVASAGTCSTRERRRAHRIAALGERRRDVARFARQWSEDVAATAGVQKRPKCYQFGGREDVGTCARMRRKVGTAPRDEDGKHGRARGDWNRLDGG